MARVGLADGDDGHAVAAALGRQVEVHDLGKLLLQQRHEHLVEGHAEHGRLVRWLAGVGGVVDRVAPVGDAVDAKDRKPVLLVVIAGVIAVGPLQGMQVATDLLDRHAMIAVAAVARGRGGDVPLQHDLGPGGHLQLQAALAHLGVRQLGAAAAQQAGELVLGQGVGHRRDGPERGGRVGAQRHGDRERLACIHPRELAEVQRPAPMGQPAHDHLVAADHLLAVDAQVLALARLGHRLRPPGDDQSPGDQRRGVARPAVLDRPVSQVHLSAFQHHLLAGRRAHPRGLHVPDGLGHVPELACLAQAARWLRLLERRQQAAHVAQLGQGGGSHAQRHPLGRAEQVGQHGHGVAGGSLEQQGRPFSPQHPVGQGRHLQMGRHRLGHAAQFTLLFQPLDEVPQVTVFHRFRL